jgi:hypothetical protein
VFLPDLFNRHIKNLEVMHDRLARFYIPQMLSPLLISFERSQAAATSVGHSREHGNIRSRANSFMSKKWQFCLDFEAVMLYSMLRIRREL